jgi:hypothetical protein
MISGTEWGVRRLSQNSSGRRSAKSCFESIGQDPIISIKGGRWTRRLCAPVRTDGKPPFNARLNGQLERMPQALL